MTKKDTGASGDVWQGMPLGLQLPTESEWDDLFLIVGDPSQSQFAAIHLFLLRLLSQSVS